VNVKKLLHEVQPYIQQGYAQASFPESVPKVEYENGI